MKFPAALFLFGLSICCSFISLRAPKEVAGTYASSVDRVRILSLTLHANGTYEYVDAMDPDQKLHFSGKWEFVQGTILLNDQPEHANRFFKKWKTDESGCIRSRHGLEWRRLCRLAEK